MTTPDAPETDCLHCKINDLVEEHIEGKEPIDVAEIASKMAESLAELILFTVPESEQPRLIAHTLQHFATYLLEKAGVGEGDTTH